MSKGSLALITTLAALVATALLLLSLPAAGPDDQQYVGSRRSLALVDWVRRNIKELGTPNVDERDADALFAAVRKQTLDQRRTTREADQARKHPTQFSIGPSSSVHAQQDQEEDWYAPHTQ